MLDAVEERFGEELRLPADYYWALPVEDAFAVYDKPELELMGQVSDDTLSVRDFLGQPSDEHVLIEHECEHFRGVLQAIEHLDISPMWETEPGEAAALATPCRRSEKVVARDHYSTSPPSFAIPFSAGPPRTEKLSS